MKDMHPLNDMCDTRVSIKNILPPKAEESCIESNVMDKTNLLLNKSNQLHFESLTEENFHRAYLCNRSIDELPNISIPDLKQLKSMNVYTMQDLLGRYLIHDSPEEFQTFLIQTSQLNKKTASTITHLFHQWTMHNLDGILINTS